MCALVTAVSLLERTHLPAHIGRYVIPLFQIIRHSKNIGESKYFKFDQNYQENYKNL
jgi:hypothetical protein